MTRTNLMALGLLAATLAAAGCGESDKPAATTGGRSAGPAAPGQKKDEPGHGHEPGPNGGVVFDFGKYHGEFTVNPEKKECTVLVLGEDEKTPTPVAAKELTLTTKPAKTKDGKAVPAMTIKLLPTDEKDGKAAKFVGTDPGLGNVATYAGTVLGEIDGKPSQGEF